ncbi:hypothetical protein EYF80_018112 [Liparis tanakae]|uniref:Uncharacterized protein n=1 Tax=Liparis tanakae TaxID=230148 RepID=A0A4Z2I1W7_9TELE|nr:hypothetical protein EYF80_018112 [Liparis tanakae]
MTTISCPSALPKRSSSYFDLKALYSVVTAWHSIHRAKDKFNDYVAQGRLVGPLFACRVS